MSHHHSAMGFVGVTTSQSSIMRIFPVWAEILDLPTRTLRSHDLPLDASPQAYRDLVTAIRDDPDHHGALVTTHKMNLYAACRDLFDEVDAFGAAAGEVSSISKRGSRLVGKGLDAVTVGLALEEFLAPDAFAAGEHVACLGAGGSGTALTWYLAHRERRPEKIWVTGRHADKLDHLRALHERSGTPDGLVEYVLDDSADGSVTAALVAGLPAGSVVANATGLGKDRPGSPVPEGTPFPREAIAWEFNYRGSLEFLHQARAQAADRGLVVVDGWRYFIHGWTQVIAEVFDLTLSPAQLEELAFAAEFAR